jgi:hypothetical protein
MASWPGNPLWRLLRHLALPAQCQIQPSSAVAAGQKSVEINFSADRNQLFTAWNAIAKPADLAGKVKVTVRADSAEGFERSKLQNGVLKPLAELATGGFAVELPLDHGAVRLIRRFQERVLQGRFSGGGQKLFSR